jgi:hypothetical protein
MEGMSHPYPPAGSDQHDTTALPRPEPAQPGPEPGWFGPPAGAGPVGGYGAGPWAHVPNPEAERWAARYHRQRTVTAVLGVAVAVALLGVLGLGVAVWQMARSSAALDSISELAGELGGSSGGLLPGDGTSPQGPGSEPDSPPDGLTGEESAPDGPSEQSSPDLSEVPLPEPLQGLGSALGITDVGELLDLAVANGLMSEEDADALRRAIAAGSAIQGLTE